MHGLVSIFDTFTCFLALDLMFYCMEDCSSLLILSHFRFIQPDSVPIQSKSGQIQADFAPSRLHFYVFLGLTRTTFFVDVATHPSVFLEGECKCG